MPQSPRTLEGSIQNIYKEFSEDTDQSCLNLSASIYETKNIALIDSFNNLISKIFNNYTQEGFLESLVIEANIIAEKGNTTPTSKHLLRKRTATRYIRQSEAAEYWRKKDIELNGKKNTFTPYAYRLRVKKGIDQNKIKHKRDGRKVYVKDSSLEKYIESWK